ncbi:MAG: response regulator transcription factor [Bacteroidetes bacterium]|jgi:DNA-binding NarL/FixJ family response regulator|nr:response regulator transcription factor [Bacteroidota bacterium]MBT4969068.1 response regulator transcription factor [Bacteroidota bacterium]MBT6686916.1 response regulator transcription factor [Bacteroidota bacterium]MBT7144882.1 response regulator transcription factor [Bacteroidota bacterium]MBT7493275.1 response regulator transcription factor [Bacteroidota bacterium]
MKKLKIFIADDHQLFTDGLEAIIKNTEKFELVGSAQDGKTAYDQIVQLQPDLAILDIRMPEIDGIKLCQKIKEELPYTKVMMVSMILEFGIIKTLLDLEVDAYVLKNAGKYELIQALNKISDGEKYFSTAVKETYFSRPSKSQTTRNIILTRREKEVLTLLSHGYIAKEIAEKLFIGQSTVETHRKHLLSKLGVKNSAEMIRFAMQNRLIE